MDYEESRIEFYREAAMAKFDEARRKACEPKRFTEKLKEQILDFTGQTGGGGVWDIIVLFAVLIQGAYIFSVLLWFIGAIPAPMGW